jgi:hypothetical protein
MKLTGAAPSRCCSGRLSRSYAATGCGRRAIGGGGWSGGCFGVIGEGKREL